MEALREGLLLGVGNPLLDISAIVQPEFLEKYNLKPNDAIMAEPQHMPLYKELISEYEDTVEYIAGGSAQNTVRVTQWVLRKPFIASFFGCVGDDENGKILRQRAFADGVNVQYQITTEAPTGTCAVLITDIARSLVANLAAANHFTADHLRTPCNNKLIKLAKYIYTTGFFLVVNLESTLILAKQALRDSATFIMNVSAPFVPQFYKQSLEEVLPYVDLLFGNDMEAKELAKAFELSELEDVSQIALTISNMPKQNPKKPRVVVITQGHDHVLLARDGKVTSIPVIALHKDKIVDTNGAGDAFTGGFLAQLALGKPLETCIKCGIYTATQIIQVSGCNFKGECQFKDDDE